MAYAFFIPFFLISKLELCKGISYTKEIKKYIYFFKK